jgi:hypothetical protein
LTSEALNAEQILGSFGVYSTWTEQEIAVDDMDNMPTSFYQTNDTQDLEVGRKKESTSMSYGLRNRTHHSLMNKNWPILTAYLWCHQLYLLQKNTKLVMRKAHTLKESNRWNKERFSNHQADPFSRRDETSRKLTTKTRSKDENAIKTSRVSPSAWYQNTYESRLKASQAAFSTTVTSKPGELNIPRAAHGCEND